MSSNVFEHPFLSGLLGDPEMGVLFGSSKDLQCMLEFETALAKIQGELGIIPAEASKTILEVIPEFRPDIQKLNTATARDGVVVPELVRQLRNAIGDPHANYLHFGATSQDVIDTSLVLRLNSGLKILKSRLERVQNDLNRLKTLFGTNTLTARTRMQSALPSTVSHHVDIWAAPLQKHHARMAELAKEIAVLQLGGPIGNGASFGKNYSELNARMAKLLQLAPSSSCWHTDRTSLVNLANWLSQVTGSLGKIGSDLAIMSLNEVAQIKLSSTGSSSAMAHKQNPVKAEILISLARFNTTLLPAMHHALVHENHRSGSAWTLEWMVLPQMMVATSAGLRTAGELLGGVKEFGRTI